MSGANVYRRESAAERSSPYLTPEIRFLNPTIECEYRRSGLSGIVFQSSLTGGDGAANSHSRQCLTGSDPSDRIGPNLKDPAGKKWRIERFMKDFFM